MDTETKQQIADFMSDFPGLTRVPSTFLTRLHQAKGRVVTKESLCYAIEDVTGIPRSPEYLNSCARNVNNAIKNSGRVVASYGVGYRLIWNNEEKSWT